MVTVTTHERRPWFGVCENNACELNADGWRVHNLWHRIPQDYPQIAISTRCIMPDHLHGILHVTERMEKPVGVPIRAFKSQCTSAMRDRHNDAALTLWNPGYNDRIVWRRGSLRAYTRYLMDNPRRYCLKKAHPDLFRTVADLQHPALPPGQREIATAILAASVGDVILMKPGGFPPFFKPNGRYFDLCVQGRLLILSCPVAAVYGDTPLTRETCLALNAACAHLAEGQTTEDNP
jgi:REP element-mobilizing transposase RayT